MQTIGRIMVAVDGSGFSLEACNAAGRLAEALGTKVDVVKVVPHGQGSDDLAEANQILRKACALASNEGRRARGTLSEASGSVVDALVNYASRKKCDLIVVGAKGSGGFKRILLGSVSSGVVTHARVPVLVVRNLTSLKGQLFGHVLAAMDGSEASRLAVEMAAKLSKLMGASLTILHVVSVPAAAYSSGSRSATGVETKDRKSAEGYLRAAKETAEDYGLGPRTRITEDLRSPVRGITEYASENQVDLIVMGTRGIGGFKRLLLGSVAAGVVSYSRCSVLVMRGG